MSFRIRDRMHLTMSEHKHVASKPQLPVSRRGCRARDRVMGVSCAAAANRRQPFSPVRKLHASTFAASVRYVSALSQSSRLRVSPSRQQEKERREERQTRESSESGTFRPFEGLRFDARVAVQRENNSRDDQRQRLPRDTISSKFDG